jgi:hypothetical protein
MSDLNEIDIEFEGEGRLFCLGRIDTMGAGLEAVDADGAAHLDCSEDGFKVEVVERGEIWVGGAMTPLAPGVYHSTDCGLLHDGVPVLAPAD